MRASNILRDRSGRHGSRCPIALASRSSSCSARRPAATNVPLGAEDHDARLDRARHATASTTVNMTAVRSSRRSRTVLAACTRLATDVEPLPRARRCRRRRRQASRTTSPSAVEPCDDADVAGTACPDPATIALSTGGVIDYLRRHRRSPSCVFEDPTSATTTPFFMRRARPTSTTLEARSVADRAPVAARRSGPGDSTARLARPAVPACSWSLLSFDRAARRPPIDLAARNVERIAPSVQYAFERGLRPAAFTLFVTTEFVELWQDLLPPRSTCSTRPAGVILERQRYIAR